MTSYRFVEKLCASCSHKNTVKFLSSTNALGSYDLDLRPPPMERFTMECWIENCIHCGFVWHDLEALDLDFPALADVMSSPKWSELYPNRSGKLSIDMERFALLRSALSTPLNEALAYQYAAWAADDEFDDVASRAYRLKAVAAFQKTLALNGTDHPQSPKISAITSDLLRVSGNFIQCLEFAEYWIKFSNDQKISKILSYQIRKAENSDSKIYKVADALA